VSTIEQGPEKRKRVGWWSGRWSEKATDRHFYQNGGSKRGPLIAFGLMGFCLIEKGIKACLLMVSFE
jgi:hypothetical protein